MELTQGAVLFMSRNGQSNPPPEGFTKVGEAKFVIDDWQFTSQYGYQGPVGSTQHWPVDVYVYTGA